MIPLYDQDDVLPVFRDRITLAVLELLESGDLAKLETKWWLDKGQCGKEGSPKKVNIVLDSCVRPSKIIQYKVRSASRHLKLIISSNFKQIQPEYIQHNTKRLLSFLRHE